MDKNDLFRLFKDHLIEARLGNLMIEDITESPKAHPEVGEEYLYYNSVDSCEWWLHKYNPGWIKFKCVYRRSGVAFFHIAGDVSPHEEAVFEDSSIIRQLYPVNLNLKTFKINPELSSIFKLAPGQTIV